MASYGLKRILGLRSAVIINLGAIIGAGIFVIIGIAAGMAGPAIIISIFVSAVIAIFTGLSFSADSGAEADARPEAGMSPMATIATTA